MTYTESVDLGVRGSKRASFQKRNYRDLALKILIANPDEDVENLVEEFMEMLTKDTDAFRSLAIYGLQNVKTALHPVRAPSPRTSPQATEKQIIEGQAAEITKKITDNLMQFMMPSGKTLADSTGAECDKVGGWFKVIGKKVGRQGVVGQKLSEEDLQKLFKGSQRTKV
jgi:hypothetical protein